MFGVTGTDALSEQNVTFFFSLASNETQQISLIDKLSVDKVGLDNYAIITKTDPFLQSVAQSIANRLISQNKTIKYNTTYTTGLLEENFINALQVVQQVENIPIDVFILVGVSVDLTVFATIFNTENYSPKAALLPSLDAVTTDLLKAATGWLVGQTYSNYSISGISGQYMGTANDYNNGFFSLFNETLPSVVVPLIGASAITWQLVVESVSDWQNIDSFREGLLALNTSCFWGPLEFNEYGIDYQKATELFQVQTTASGYNLSFINDATQIVIPTVWPWDVSAMHHSSGGDGTTAGFIAGLTVLGVCVCFIIIGLMVVIGVILGLSLKFHFYCLQRS